MTHPAAESVEERLDPRRALNTALAGLALQGVGALLTILLASLTDSRALAILQIQVGAGALVWLMTFLHLRVRQAAREEALDIAEAERRRQQQGMARLFEEAEEGRAARGLRHMERFVAPAASLVEILLLLVPGLYVLALTWGAEAGGVFRRMPALAEGHLLAGAVGAVVLALGFLLLGFYAAGLARLPRWRLLRAGAGAMLSSALFLGLGGVALAVARQGWIGPWPDRLVAAAIWIVMLVHALEMLVNFILDFYRPRVAGEDPRPCYDSRLTGLLAEPTGLFQTFAHTMDYQFGFRVSETWFFRFLEKAFAPLLLIQLLTFYLLSCFVVVRPGESVVIERWGAPRGVDALPEDLAAWDRLAPPGGPGFHLKWPWPVETARVVPTGRIRTLYVGYAARDGEEEQAKARTLGSEIITWDAEHIEEEFRYLMPMPRAMRSGEMGTTFRSSARELGLEAYEREGETVRRVEERQLVDALFLSGLFTLEYRVGDRPGDVYRYVYRHRDARATLRALAEREVTAYMAGANFWDIMVDRPDEARAAMAARIRAAMDEAELGLVLVALNLQNVHPPVGEVGKAYQGVLAAREEKEALVYGGEVAAVKVLGMAPSAYNEKVTQAEAYRHRRTRVAEAEAERFRAQMEAYRAAPEAYVMRERLAALEAGLATPRKVILPKEATPIIDDTQLLSPTAVEEALVREAQNP